MKKGSKYDEGIEKHQTQHHNAVIIQGCFFRCLYFVHK